MEEEGGVLDLNFVNLSIFNDRCFIFFSYVAQNNEAFFDIFFTFFPVQT